MSLRLDDPHDITLLHDRGFVASIFTAVPRVTQQRSVAGLNVHRGGPYKLAVGSGDAARERSFYVRALKEKLRPRDGIGRSFPHRVMLSGLCRQPQA